MASLKGEFRRDAESIAVGLVSDWLGIICADNARESTIRESSTAGASEPQQSSRVTIEFDASLQFPGVDRRHQNAGNGWSC